MLNALQIRFATQKDVPTILQFIRALAEYENIRDQVTATEQDLERTLFGERQYAEVLLGEEGGRVVAFAFFFHNYSTLLGKPGIYLEDLFVLPECRGKGHGGAMLQRLAEIALERDCGRFEWWVLDWNTPAIEFYKSVGAIPMDEWTVFRVTGESLKRLGGSA